ncbi:MAG: hypothetical protein OEV31_06150, partial [Gammaproteobacteria bacterium]|nr:hypothetical protein [Gammaproteobacteria bacterium]
MSLVNKMLKDLEARQSVSVDGRSVFEGLQPARPATATTPRSARLFIWVSAGIFIVAAVGVTSLRQGATVSLPALTQVPPPVSAVVVVDPAVTVPLPPAVAPARQAVTEPPLHKRRTDTAKPMPAPAPHPKAAGTARIAKTERPYSAEERAEEGYREALSLRTQGNVAAAERAL